MRAGAAPCRAAADGDAVPTRQLLSRDSSVETFSRQALYLHRRRGMLCAAGGCSCSASGRCAEQGCDAKQAGEAGWLEAWLANRELAAHADITSNATKCGRGTASCKRSSTVTRTCLTRNRVPDRKGNDSPGSDLASLPSCATAATAPFPRGHGRAAGCHTAGTVPQSIPDSDTGARETLARGCAGVRFRLRTCCAIIGAPAKLQGRRSGRVRATRGPLSLFELPRQGPAPCRGKGPVQCHSKRLRPLAAARL